MVMRISGMASGLDIDTMVKNLMTAERMPLDKLKQKKQTIEWQRDDYRSMNTLLLDFRSTLTQMKLSSNYRVRTIASSDDTKVTATASSAAAQTSFSIKNVTSLASAETMVNAGAISKNSKTETNKGLYEIKDNFDSNNFNWDKGSVEAQTITLAKGSATTNLKLATNQTFTASTDMNVKVNGENYTIITDSTHVLAAKEVFVQNDGTLTFHNDLAKTADVNVKVDFIADNKIDTFTVGADTKKTQLSKGSIADGSLSLKITQGSTTTNYTLDGDGTSIKNGEITYGTLDSKTGEINWGSNMTFAADSKIEANYKQNFFKFKIDTSTSKGAVSENFLIQGTDSLNTVMDKVNSSNVGVSMVYDSFKDQVSLSRTETGKFNKLGQDIQIEGDFLTKALNFTGAAGTVTAGTNAVFSINGLATERNSNNFTVNGVSFTLKNTFGEPAVTVSVNNDSNKVFENVKDFITKYNDLIDKIQKKTSEERYRDYTPLTDTQREQLSDKQQEQWEEKAKSGMLRNDSILKSVLTQMRSNFYTTVQNSEVSTLYNQLSRIGITTTANYLDGGKLQIDDAKLKAAIEADPQSVEKLFNANGTTDAQKGIVQRLYDTVSNTMDQLKERAGNSFSTNTQFTLGKQLNSLATSISSFEDRLTSIEDRYYKQFTAMEKAMSQANSQSASLASYFTQK